MKVFPCSSWAEKGADSTIVQSDISASFIAIDLQGQSFNYYPMEVGKARCTARFP